MSIWAKALRFLRAKAQRRRTQRSLSGRIIFVDSKRPIRFCEKMLRVWSPWRAAPPVFVETLILAARDYRGLFEILIFAIRSPRFPKIPHFGRWSQRGCLPGKRL